MWNPYRFSRDADRAGRPGWGEASNGADRRGRRRGGRPSDGCRPDHHDAHRHGPNHRRGGHRPARSRYRLGMIRLGPLQRGDEARGQCRRDFEQRLVRLDADRADLVGVMCPRRQISGSSQRGSAFWLRPTLMRNQAVSSNPSRRSRGAGPSPSISSRPGAARRGARGPGQAAMSSGDFSASRRVASSRSPSSTSTGASSAASRRSRSCRGFPPGSAHGRHSASMRARAACPRPGDGGDRERSGSRCPCGPRGRYGPNDAATPRHRGGFRRG